MSDDFDWNDLDSEDDILGHQARTSIYENVRGAIVIRQEAGPLEEDDAWVIIRPENIPALIAALRRHLPADRPDGGGEARPPMTSAERKRRQRERERHADTGGVTPDVTPGHVARDMRATPDLYDIFMDAPLAPAGAAAAREDKNSVPD